MSCISYGIDQNEGIDENGVRQKGERNERTVRVYLLSADKMIVLYTEQYSTAQHSVVWSSTLCYVTVCAYVLLLNAYKAPHTMWNDKRINTFTDKKYSPRFNTMVA